MQRIFLFVASRYMERIMLLKTFAKRVIPEGLALSILTFASFTISISSICMISIRP